MRALQEGAKFDAQWEGDAGWVALANEVNRKWCAVLSAAQAERHGQRDTGRETRAGGERDTGKETRAKRHGQRDTGKETQAGGERDKGTATQRQRQRQRKAQSMK